jgi:hypothetical protein
MPAWRFKEFVSEHELKRVLHAWAAIHMEQQTSEANHVKDRQSTHVH